MHYRNIALVAACALLLFSTMAIMRLQQSSVSSRELAEAVKSEPAQSAVVKDAQPAPAAEPDVKEASQPAKAEPPASVEASAPEPRPSHPKRIESPMVKSPDESASAQKPEQPQEAAQAKPYEPDPQIQAMDRARRTCRDNLWKIEAAKEKWAADNQKRFADLPTRQDLAAYIKEMPKCPSGGTYETNSLGCEPCCSIHGGMGN